MKYLLLPALFLSVLVFAPLTTKAESAQSTANSSQLYNSTSSSTFQGASFTQSGSSAASSASGSSSLLLNPASSALTVTDGPKDATTAITTKSSRSISYYLYSILAVSLVGFLVTFLNIKRSKRSEDVTPDTEPEVVKKQKNPKKKRRNKKHHR